jgi:hypothetical protein
VRQYRVSDLFFVKEILQTYGYAHGRTPFALRIDTIIALHTAKRNMYAVSPELRAGCGKTSHRTA